jgi:hypothetical protein
MADNSYSRRVGRAVQEAFLRQRIAPWGGMDFSGVNPPVDWDAIGKAAIAAMRAPTKEIIDAVSFESKRYDVEKCVDGTFMIVDGYRSAARREGLTAADEPQDIADDMNGKAAWEKGIDAALGE